MCPFVPGESDFEANIPLTDHHHLLFLVLCLCTSRIDVCGHALYLHHALSYPSSHTHTRYASVLPSELRAIEVLQPYFSQREESALGLQLSVDVPKGSLSQQVGIGYYSLGICEEKEAHAGGGG